MKNIMKNIDPAIITIDLIKDGLAYLGSSL